jgi:hypothetical protein
LPEGHRDDQGGTQKKHPAPVLVTLRKGLSDAETEVIEEDWSECMGHIKTARAARSK